MFPLFLFISFGTLISARDFKERRIPNTLNLLLFSLLLVTGVFTSINRTINGFTFALIYFGTFLGLQLLSRGNLGMGDVKFSASCGFVIGYYAKDQWLIALWLFFVFAGIVGLIGIAINRASLKTALPFAPAMTIVTILVGFNSLVNHLS